MHIHYRYTLSLSETFTRTDYRPIYWSTGLSLAHGWWFVSIGTDRDSGGGQQAQVSLGVSLAALASGEHKEHPRIIHTH